MLDCQKAFREDGLKFECIPEICRYLNMSEFAFEIYCCQKIKVVYVKTGLKMTK